MSAQEALREMYAEGIERWPSIRVTLEEFQRQCERICEGESPVEELPRHAADIYLCCACVKQDPLAIAIFERETEEVVRGAISRVHRDEEFVRETQQEFWKKLLVGPSAKINDYRGRGPLQAWLRVAAARLALDRYRAERQVAVREVDLGDSLADQIFGPESTLTRARYHEPFRLAFRHAIAGLDDRDRNLLRMHVDGRCSIDQIGRAYNVHRATAARWLDQAKDHILKAVRTELELVGPHLTDSEFQSVARVIGGELEVELSPVSTDAALQSSPSTR